ncbi:MAG TPA: HAD-IIIC family phosphatase [Acidobacteriaceae bacterium]|nr:HAD-IIIC family phosphatase [Acidobacteriaceae bacterium]
MQIDSERSSLRRELDQAVRDGDAVKVLAITRRLLSVSTKPADHIICASSLARIPDAIHQLGARRLRTFWVRSVTVEPYIPYVVVEAALNGFMMEFETGGYGSFADELLNPESSLARFQPELVLVSLDLEDIAGALPDLCAKGARTAADAEVENAVARMGDLLRTFRSLNSARLAVQGAVIPHVNSLGEVADANLPNSLRHAVQQLNLRLSGLCGSISDCVFFDVDHVASNFGRTQWRDERMFLASRLQVSSQASPAYAQGLVRSFSVLYRPPRKVLCTDLDNTLWGGVLGEDGPEGISTGHAFPGNCYFEYQKYLKQLSSRGILIAIASKNNEADVREAFQLRAADLALNLDDFVATRINWNDKSESIREIAEELSLGLDSFVFVDDNPAECEAIRRQLPGVAVVDAPASDPWRLTEVLANQAFFDTNMVTSDDLHRVVEYKAQTQRAELERNATSRDQFLASMNIVCSFQSALEAPLARSVQLLAKTNQFNLTTHRYSAAKVEEFASLPGGQAVVVRVRDRFGDSGVVGLALARTLDATCVMDSLLLSCRVIGRGIETALLAQIAERAIRSGARRLLGEYIPTKKNSPCATFYEDHGFAECPSPAGFSPNSKVYELDLTVVVPAIPEWITVEGNEKHELTSSAVESA